MIEIAGKSPTPGAGGFDEFHRHHFVSASRLAYLLTGCESLAPEIAQFAYHSVGQVARNLHAYLDRQHSATP